MSKSSLKPDSYAREDSSTTCGMHFDMVVDIVKLCSDKVKANTKAKIFIDVCCLFVDDFCLYFDLFRCYSRFHLV